MFCAATVADFAGFAWQWNGFKRNMDSMNYR